MYTTEQLNSMKKSELIDVIMNLQTTRVKKSHKKYIVLDIMKSHEGPISIRDIADILDERCPDGAPHQTTNVSSLLHYLRTQDSIQIHTDPAGRKYII